MSNIKTVAAFSNFKMLLSCFRFFKKRNWVLLAFIPLFLFSCSKSKNVLNVEKNLTIETKIPDFLLQSNSTLLEQKKHPTPIERETKKMMENKKKNDDRLHRLMIKSIENAINGNRGFGATFKHTKFRNDQKIVQDGWIVVQKPKKMKIMDSKPSGYIFSLNGKTASLTSKADGSVKEVRPETPISILSFDKIKLKYANVSSFKIFDDRVDVKMQMSKDDPSFGYFVVSFYKPSYLPTKIHIENLKTQTSETIELSYDLLYKQSFPRKVMIQ